MGPLYLRTAIYSDCRHHFLKFSFLEQFDRNRSNQKKQLFRTFYLFGFWFQWLESTFAHKKTWLKPQSIFWESRIWRMPFLLDLGFWHSVKEAWTRLFPTQNSTHLYTRKRLQKTHNLTEEVWTIIFIPICSILASSLFQFYFCFIFMARSCWGSDKSTRKSRPFLSVQR